MGDIASDYSSIYNEMACDSWATSSSAPTSLYATLTSLSSDSDISSVSSSSSLPSPPAGFGSPSSVSDTDITELSHDAVVEDDETSENTRDLDKAIASSDPASDDMFLAQISEPKPAAPMQTLVQTDV